MTLWKIFKNPKLKPEMDCLRFFMMEKVVIIKLADVTLENIHNPSNYKNLSPKHSTPSQNKLIPQRNFNNEVKK